MIEDEISVSVVIPVYNQERTIARTLDSVLRQECNFKYEIIIGDDCSTDTTLQICHRYQEQYPSIIKILANSKNKGVLNNYYDCVLSANGKYIADLAGDDFWIDNEKLQLQYDLLENDPECSLVHTDWQYYTETTGTTCSPWKDKIYPYPRDTERGELVKLILQQQFVSAIHTCTAMYRKASFLDIYSKHTHLFRERRYQVEDLQLITLLSHYSKVRFIDRVTLNYSQSDNSLTGKKNYIHLFDLYYGATDLTCELEKITSTPHDMLTEMYARKTHFLAMQAFRSLDTERMKMLKLSPCLWHYKPSRKTELIFSLSSNRMIWKISAWGWNLYRKIWKRRGDRE